MIRLLQIKIQQWYDGLKYSSRQKYKTEKDETTLPGKDKFIQDIWGLNYDEGEMLGIIADNQACQIMQRGKDEK